MKRSIEQRILSPKYVGRLESRTGMRYSFIEEIDSVRRARLSLSLLIDEEDGIITDAAFHVFGPPYLILAADLLCEVILRKTHVQAKKLRADMLEKAFGPFPEKEGKWLNFSLSALDAALEPFLDLATKTVTPVSGPPPSEENYHEEFPLLSHTEKLALIETILDDEIRPYVEMDAGGVTIQGLEEYVLKISYEGACTTCYAASGSTLSAIQNILQTKVHPDLTVTPVDLFV